MQNFFHEFHTLNYAIKGCDSILLFAHTRPDGDTVGSALALKEYIKSLGKTADIACYDALPAYLTSFSTEIFLDPEKLDLAKYKLIIATDSVERGFEKIFPRLDKNQITVIIDHHPDITLSADVTILDSTYSSVCELVHNFFLTQDIEITQSMSTYLMLGILNDADVTTFQHHFARLGNHLRANEKRRANGKIINATFNSKKISTLKLWGRAFERARINEENGMIVSVLTKADMAEFDATSEDIAQVATILNTVPNTKFSLILSERGDGVVKGSLRSEKYKDVNVSTLAAKFGGGGHTLASGFEIKGKIVETENGWKIE